MRSSVRLVTNGTIHTGDPATPHAEAFVIQQERLAYVGSADRAADKAQALSSAEPNPYETLDLRGAHVLPGLTDAHMHLDWYALGLEQVQSGTDTLDTCLERVADRVEQRLRGAGSPDWAGITTSGEAASQTVSSSTVSRQTIRWP